MYVVHFYESGELLLSQYRKNLPAVGDAFKVKGRKGKVIGMEEVKQNTYHIQFLYDPLPRRRGSSAMVNRKSR